MQNEINKMKSFLEKQIQKDTDFKDGDKVVIKGYKKTHTIDAVFSFNPPKEKSTKTYHLSDTPKNKRYYADDLVKK